MSHSSFTNSSWLAAPVCGGMITNGPTDVATTILDMPPPVPLFGRPETRTPVGDDETCRCQLCIALVRLATNVARRRVEGMATMAAVEGKA